MDEKFEYIIAAIEESNDLSALIIQQLMGSLKSHEAKKLQNCNNSVESVFNTSFTTQISLTNQGNS